MWNSGPVWHYSATPSYAGFDNAVLSIFQRAAAHWHCKPGHKHECCVDTAIATSMDYFVLLDTMGTPYCMFSYCFQLFTNQIGTCMTLHFGCSWRCVTAWQSKNICDSVLQNGVCKRQSQSRYRKPVIGRTDLNRESPWTEEMASRWKSCPWSGSSWEGLSSLRILTTGKSCTSIGNGKLLLSFNILRIRFTCTFDPPDHLPCTLSSVQSVVKSMLDPGLCAVLINFRVWHYICTLQIVSVQVQ